LDEERMPTHIHRRRRAFGDDASPADLLFPRCAHCSSASARKWEPDVLDYAGKPHDRPDGEAVVGDRPDANIGRWRSDLAPWQVAEVMSHGGKLLYQLGYLDGGSE
jgi:hypothetical protein